MDIPSAKNSDTHTTDIPQVLLVDSDEKTGTALADAIGGIARIEQVTTGEAALQFAEKNELAAILIDVSLPGIDGFQTVTRLRRTKHATHVPVLFLSEAAPDWLAVRRGYDLGAMGYMVKPADAHALRAKLEVLITLFRRGVEVRRRDELIAQQHKAIQDAQAALEQVTAANRAKDLYLGVLGHDLRTPLGAILMSARMMLMRGPTSDIERTSVARIARNAERMAALIRDILDYTRGQAVGGIPISTRRADMVEIAAAMLDEVRLVHPDRSIKLTTHGIPTGHWDRERVEQVISNLLANAIAHGRGDIGLVVDGRDPDAVTVSVHNNGVIPAEQLPSLFEPFKRGASSRIGLGLGLYIVREIMRAHEGVVTVQSTVEDGTRFVTRWPRIPAAPRSEET